MNDAFEPKIDVDVLRGRWRRLGTAQHLRRLLVFGPNWRQCRQEAQAEANQAMVEAANAAVVEHFEREVSVVSAAADRTTDTGLFVAGKYQRPGDRVRDFLATVVKPTRAAASST